MHFEALDLAVTSICNRFDRKGFKTFSNVERLLFKACKGQCFHKEFDLVCNFFYNDFNKEDLVVELSTIYMGSFHVKSTQKNLYPHRFERNLVFTQCTLLTLSKNQRMLLSSVCRLFQLLTILPATNATSEKSYSALRRIKSYLRSTMTQARLNHLMVLHYHQDRCDSLDLKAIENNYIIKNETRRTFDISSTF